MKKVDKPEGKMHDFERDVTRTINQHFSEDQEAIEKKKREIVGLISVGVLRYKNWATQGARMDNVQEIRDEHHFKAVEDSKQLVKLNLKKALNQLVEHQAHAFWLLRGGKEDSDKNRMENDYFDGKRYIGFLLADTLIERCRCNDMGIDCLEYLQREFFEYLVALSVEEFIRIKAYFRWEFYGRPLSDDVVRMNIDYFNAMDCIQNTMWNCKNRKPALLLNLQSMNLIKEFFLNRGMEQLEGIKRAKNYVGRRLNFEMSSDIEVFVTKFYRLLQSILEDGSVDAKEVSVLLNFLYANTHVANMMEFILRCFLCSFIPRDVHNAIRKEYNRGLLPASQVIDLPQKRCSL